MVKIIPAKQQQQMPIATCFISFCEYPILSKKPQNKIETKNDTHAYNASGIFE